MERLPRGYIPETVSSLTLLANSFREQGTNWQERIAGVCGLGLNGHGARVGCMNCILAESCDDLDPIEATMAGQLHDIGKILIPDAILDHNGALSESQRAIINKHPDYGQMILTTVLEFPNVSVVTNAALSHHERWDGSGYPNGLGEDEIPIEARMTSISDVIDALASPRSYKAGWEWNKIMSLLVSESGKAFDPELVALTLDNMPEIIAARENEIVRQKMILPMNMTVQTPELVVTTGAICEENTPLMPKPVQPGIVSSISRAPNLGSFGSC